MKCPIIIFRGKIDKKGDSPIRRACRKNKRKTIECAYDTRGFPDIVCERGSAVNARQWGRRSGKVGKQSFAGDRELFRKDAGFTHY